ncbi:MAG: hypothetical protein JSS49_05155 [Planctomycetes bacterium]|nr:hypothetical protein [Planctomycetota bacterium]
MMARSNSNRIVFVVIVAWIAVCIAMGVLSRTGSNLDQVSMQQTAHAAFTTADESPTANLRTLSCSTSNCHGDLVPDPRDNSIRRDEYFVWLTDPHFRATRTLSDERSRLIFQNLGVADEHLNPLPGQTEKFQKQWDNCLACHETNRHLTGSATSHQTETQTEGVSCESCHGDARNWLPLHSRPEWKAASADQQRDLINGHDLTVRVKQCSACHVGSRDGGDVNHDLIAAGHPALRFEYVWYRSRLPRHWKPTRESATPSTGATHAVQTWLVGQLVSAISALEQLERRTAEHASNSIGTELAEFNCFACHHDLQGPSWRQSPKPHKERQLTTPWGNWSLQLLTTLADQHGTINAREFSLTFDRLRAGLQQSPNADRIELNRLTIAARERLEVWLADICRLSEQDAEAILRDVGRQHSERLLTSWDQTANVVLGFAAPFRDSETIPDLLQDAMNRIRFPKSIDSPQSFRSTDGESPQTADDLFRKLADLPNP